MKELLQKAGLKVTPARLLLLKSLKEYARPITIQDLISRESIGNKMNKTTLYRSLEKMADAGLLYKTSFQGDAVHYEWQDNHHHHITCTNCGLRDSIDCPSKIIKTDRVTSKNFETVATHVLEYFGLCNTCK